MSCAVNQTSDEFWRRFYVDVNSGVIYSKGNQTTQYNFSSTIGYPRDRWGVQGSYNSSLSSSSGVEAATRNQPCLSGYKLAHWKNWYYSLTAAFLQSTEQSISVQTNVGGGMGYLFKNTNRINLSMLGGLTWQNTQYESSSNTDAQNILAAMLSANLTMFTFSKTNVQIRANMLPALSDPGASSSTPTRATTSRSGATSSSTSRSTVTGTAGPPNGLSGSDYGLEFRAWVDLRERSTRTAVSVGWLASRPDTAPCGTGK